ncbi:MAG: hypothetical protein U1F17_08430 [Burkholderiaceae bacterium]
MNAVAGTVEGPVEMPIPIAGASGTSIGIATQAARVADVAVLILPAAGEPRTGPERLYVRLARELSRAGLPSLRFDASDGGDCSPGMGSDPRYDEDAVAAARQLLALHPDAFVAVLAIGRGAVRAAHAWRALARADLPLSALCLIDPQIEMALDAPRPGWWRRMFGARAAAPSLAGASDGGRDTAQLWRALPAAVHAARSRLLVVSRAQAASNPALSALARGDRDWRRALRRSRGWLQVEGAEAGFTESAEWRELTAWVAARLAV